MAGRPEAGLAGRQRTVDPADARRIAVRTRRAELRRAALERLADR